ncbi:MAG: cobalamin-dependent protein [Myxococcales bacterium]|nr:cobalamin-dependent protein [Myxococcales bacterium]
MKVRFIYAAFTRHAEDHPELLESVPCDEYFGPPSLGIASIAAVTPKDWDLDFRDDRFEEVGFDDDVDLVAISCFTPSGKRALELADTFRAHGKKVVMGGIFPSAMPELALEHADAVVQGEGEGVWHEVLAATRRGELKGLYQAKSPVDPATLPLPRVDLYLDKECERYRPDDYPVQLSRGCPLRCEACAIPLSLGRKMRNLSIEHCLGQIDQLGKRGKLASLTEDTSFFPGAPRRHLENLLDALIERGTEAAVSYVGISMPMILAADEVLFEKLHKAGVRMFYLVGGFDPITKGAFTGKNDQALERAYAAIKRSLDHGIDPYTSFLVGNEDDDEGVFDRMLDFGQRSGLRKAEFAIRTPYPGTPVWHTMLEQDRILHREWNRYNDANVVFKPAQMSPERLQEGYLYLWKEFYKERENLTKLDHRERTIQF